MSVVSKDLKALLKILLHVALLHIATRHRGVNTSPTFFITLERIVSFF